MDEGVAPLAWEPRLARPGAIGDRLVVEEVLRLLGVRQGLPYRRIPRLLRLRRRCLCLRLGLLDRLGGRLDGGDDGRGLAGLCVPGQEIVAADPFLAGFPDPLEIPLVRPLKEWSRRLQRRCARIALSTAALPPSFL